VAAAREAGDAGFDVLIACAFSYDTHASEFDKLGRIPVLKARMNADLHMADDLKNTGKGNLFVIFDSFDILQLDLEADCKLTAMIEGTLVSPERAQALHSVGSPTPRIRNIAKHMECEIRFQTAPS
jgi:adenine-specific DNA-methyltransferase